MASLIFWIIKSDTVRPMKCDNSKFSQWQQDTDSICISHFHCNLIDTEREREKLWKSCLTHLIYRSCRRAFSFLQICVLRSINLKKNDLKAARTEKNDRFLALKHGDSIIKNFHASSFKDASPNLVKNLCKSMGFQKLSLITQSPN